MNFSHIACHFPNFPTPINAYNNALKNSYYVFTYLWTPTSPNQKLWTSKRWSRVACKGLQRRSGDKAHQGWYGMTSFYQVTWTKWSLTIIVADRKMVTGICTGRRWSWRHLAWTLLLLRSLVVAFVGFLANRKQPKRENVSNDVEHNTGHSDSNSCAWFYFICLGVKFAHNTEFQLKYVYESTNLKLMCSCSVGFQQLVFHGILLYIEMVSFILRSFVLIYIYIFW